MSRILLIIGLVAGTLAAKDRVYQTGTLLDKSLNPYIRTTESGDSGPRTNEFMNGTVMVAVNANRSAGAVTYEDYVVEVDDIVYLIEVAHMKTYKAPRLSLSRPVYVAVEKNKLYIKDLDNAEYSGDILKQVSKNGPKESSPKQGDQLAAVETKPAPAVGTAVATAVTTKTPAKPDPFAVASTKAAVQPVAQAPAPKPAPKAETPKVEAAVTKAPEKPASSGLATPGLATPGLATPGLATPGLATPGLATPKDPKPAPKVEAVVTKPVEKPASAPKPESVRQESTASRASTIKERAWQGGQLLSIVNNNYFFNVTYSADTEGTSWPFTQGSDGRYTVNGQIANPTNSLYTYDNYCIESQFVVYLVQRMRPKTSPPVRLPGTQALKFAVEKSKLWVMDEQSIEYEMKVVKLVQKQTIVDPLTRAAARN